jgi:hypothetical protein
MYLYATDYKYRHIYDLDKLNDYSDYADRDIQRCYEMVEIIKKYQLGIHEHFQDVLQTDFKKYVVLHRRENYGTKRIEYFVRLEHRPQVEKDCVDGSFVYGTQEGEKQFKGTERHLAFSYAEELSKAHNAPIERKGFPKKH